MGKALAKTKAGRTSFDEFVARLENMILTGRFRPRERLVEADLCNMLGVSRYWVRDAFKILQAKHLVEVTPFKGVTVAELSEREIEEIFVIRVELEKLAMRLAVGKVTEQSLRELEEYATRFAAAVLQNDLAAMIQIDSSFHDLIFALTANETLRRMINDLRKRCHIVRYTAWSSSEILTKVVEEHKRFVELLRLRDRVGLEKLAARHISHARNFYIFRLHTATCLEEGSGEK